MVVVWPVASTTTGPTSTSTTTPRIERADDDRYHPGYFGKVGMRYFHKQQNHFWKPVINLDKVRPPLIATVN